MKFLTILWYFILMVLGDFIIVSTGISMPWVLALSGIWGFYLGTKLAKTVRRW